MSNFSNQDKKAILRIVAHMEKNNIMRTSLRRSSLLYRRLRRTYVEKMEFTPKQLTAAIMVYNRKHGTKF